MRREPSSSCNPARRSNCACGFPSHVSASATVAGSHCARTPARKAKHCAPLSSRTTGAVWSGAARQANASKRHGAASGAARSKGPHQTVRASRSTSTATVATCSAASSCQTRQAAVPGGVSANAMRAVTKHSTLFLERTLWKRGENGGEGQSGQERHTSTMVAASPGQRTHFI